MTRLEVRKHILEGLALARHYTTHYKPLFEHDDREAFARRRLSKLLRLALPLARRLALQEAMTDEKLTTTQQRKRRRRYTREEKAHRALRAAQTTGQVGATIEDAKELLRQHAVEASRDFDLLEKAK